MTSSFSAVTTVFTSEGLKEIPAKNDDVIYEQPLISIHKVSFSCVTFYGKYSNITRQWKIMVTPNVHESNPGQTGNKQDPLPPLGSHPSRALAREDLPEPVGPTITIFGLGSSESKSCFSEEVAERKVIINRHPVGPMVATVLSVNTQQ